MTSAFLLFATLLKIIGVVFLFAAALGLMRFRDPLLRMHASTKAGTIGAGLVLAGAVISAGGGSSTTIGIAAILFLLLTVPVAGHLLGRAAYISGTELQGLEGNDALAGILDRRSADPAAAVRTAPPRPTTRPAEVASAPAEDKPLAPLTSVRFAIIAPHEISVASRALSIAGKAWDGTSLPIEARAVVDAHVIATAHYADQTRQTIKDRLADAVSSVEREAASRGQTLNLLYSEGDAEQLIANADDTGQLLVLPASGWCHHGVELSAAATRQPDGLLRLPGLHAGPVLFVADEPPPRQPTIVVADGDGDGEAAIAGIEWAVRARLWDEPRFLIRGQTATNRVTEIGAALAGRGITVPLDALPQKPGDTTLIPPENALAYALLTPQLSKPLRTDWYGHGWRDRIAPGWKGEVLVLPQ